MNSYFYRIWLPMQALNILCLSLVFIGSVKVSWGVVFVSWFLIGPIGTGVGFHRLFSHRQFETTRPLEIMLAVLGTLTAYAPVLFWAAIHQQHHRISDTKEDISSPKIYGFWQSFLYYRLRKDTLNKIHVRNDCVVKILKDPFLLWISTNFTLIIWIVYLGTACMSLQLLVSCLVLPSLIEHTRTNIISSLSHLNVPFSYRNFATNDSSQNNFILGFLSFGFAWHNNHHYDPGALCLTHKWWELDIEGLCAKLISKRPNLN